MQKFSLPPTMVGALTQPYIKNGGSKIRLHKTLVLTKWVTPGTTLGFYVFKFVEFLTIIFK